MADELKGSREHKKVPVALDRVTVANIKQLKILNRLTFPIRYGAKFYSIVLEQDKFSRLAYYNDILVGAVCSKVDSMEEGDINYNPKNKKVYIMTLGVLRHYRGFGVGSKLLEYIVELVKKHPEIKLITLHVQSDNESALEFYKKHGFTVLGLKENYYPKLDPPHAYALEKTVNSE